MRRALRGLSAIILAAGLLLLCGACRTPGEYWPERNDALYPIQYPNAEPPSTDVYRPHLKYPRPSYNR